MELFFFLLIGIIILLAYWSNRESVHEGKLLIIILGLLFIAYSVNQSGLEIPNTGVVFSGNTATFIGTTYTISSINPFSINNGDHPILFAVFWGSFSLGILGFVELIGFMLNKSRSRRVITNG